MCGPRMVERAFSCLSGNIQYEQWCRDCRARFFKWSSTSINQDGVSGYRYCCYIVRTTVEKPGHCSLSRNGLLTELFTKLFVFVSSNQSCFSNDRATNMINLDPISLVKHLYITNDSSQKHAPYVKGNGFISLSTSLFISVVPFLRKYCYYILIHGR